jgi:DNA polymerase-3 subunit delta'
VTSSDLASPGGLSASLGRLGASLERTVSTDRLSPSYLFEGADHDLVREAATAFCARVLGADVEGPARQRVERLVAKGTHPDFHVQGKDKATVISVAALTAVLAEAHGAPIAGRRQVFLIDPAEAMEPEGVARYLKALEEPPRGTVFVLVTTRADRLPETVLSRVQRIRIPPGSVASIRARLEADGADPMEADTLARWAGGSLARARRFAATGVPDVVRALVGAASSAQPRTAGVVDAALATLGKDAADLAESTGEGRPDRKREAVRVLLTDVLYALSVEARDLVAGRTDAGLLRGVDADVGLRLLERLGALAAAVPANVTPAVVLVEAVRILRVELASGGA